MFDLAILLLPMFRLCLPGHLFPCSSQILKPSSVPFAYITMGFSNHSPVFLTFSPGSTLVFFALSLLLFINGLISSALSVRVKFPFINQLPSVFAVPSDASGEFLFEAFTIHLTLVPLVVDPERLIRPRSSRGASAKVALG